MIDICERKFMYILPTIQLQLTDGCV